MKQDEFYKLKFNQFGDIPTFIFDFVDYIIGQKGTFQKLLTTNLSKKVDE